MLTMTSYRLISSFSRNSAALQSCRRNVRSLGTLAYQYLHSRQKIENQEGSVNLSSMSGAMDKNAFSEMDSRLNTNFLHSRPETALGAVHSAELLSFASPEADFSAQQLPHTDIDESKYDKAMAHSAAMFSFASPESDFTAEKVPRATNRILKQSEPLNPDDLVMQIDSAFGAVHAAEYMTDEMKSDFLAANGLEHSPRHDDILFQEFVDNLALMTSPESACGFISTTEMLDDDAKDVLRKLQSQVDKLPKSLEEAMTDPRAVVVTSLQHPFDITDVNEAWVGLCGYERQEAIHKNLGTLLQGPETDRDLAESIIPQLRKNHFANVTLTNYTKQGRQFKNHLQAGLIRDKEGTAQYFVGVLEELYDTQGSKLRVSA